MRLLHSSLAVFLTQISVQAISLLPSVLISRRFGPEGKGLIALWLYLPALLCEFSAVGLAAGAQYFVSRKEDSPAEQLGSVLMLPLIVSFLAVGAFYLTYSFWQSYLENMPFVRLIPALLILPTMLIQSNCSQLLVALGRVTKRNIVMFVQTTTGALLIGGLLLFPDLKVDTVLWGYICGFAVGALFALGFAYRAAGGIRIPSWALTLRSLSYGVWIYLSALIRMLSSRVSFFLLVAMTTISDAGVFSVCMSITSPLVALPWAVQAVLFPISAAQSAEEARRHTPRYVRQLIIVLFVMVCGIAILSRPILGIFGSEFVSGQVALIIMLVGIILAGQGVVVASYLMGRGKPQLLTAATALRLVVSVILCYALIPSLGLEGGALATLGGQIAFSVPVMVLFVKIAKLPLGEVLRFRRSDLDVFSRMKQVIVDSVRRA